VHAIIVACAIEPPQETIDARTFVDDDRALGHLRTMTMTRATLLNRVKELVADVTRARFAGGAYAKLARAHGYADGYMRALLDAGLVTRTELIEACGSERGRVVRDELTNATEQAA
jgi:hypothetical protein